MKTNLLLAFTISCMCLRAQSPSLFVSVISTVHGKTLTCAHPELTFVAASTPVGATFTWTSPGGQQLTSTTISINTPGTYSLSGQLGAQSGTTILNVSINTVVPVSATSSTFLVTTPTLYTYTAVSPTTNITHYIYGPLGSTFVATDQSGVYLPGSQGTYTHCIVNDLNGCTSCQGLGMPGFPGSPGTITGLTEGERGQELVFPNPNKGMFRLKLKEPTRGAIELYNSLGVRVQETEQRSGEVEFDIRSEQAGIYFIKIPAKNGSVRYLKVLKE